MENQKKTLGHKIGYFALLFTVALSALSIWIDLFAYLFFALYAALACTVLFRNYHPASAAVAPVLSFLLMGALVGFSFTTLVLSLLPAAVGFSLATGLRGGEGRLSLSFSATAAAAFVLVGYLALTLYEMATAAGATDLVAYIAEVADAVKAEFVAFQVEGNAEVAKLLDARGIAYVLPTEAEIVAMVNQMAALAPGIVVVLLFCAALLFTYGLQLLSMLLDDDRLFSRRNAQYTVSPFLAGVYLFVTLVTLFYVDFASPFYLVCINTAWVLAPILAFAGFLKAPRLVGFIRRMSHSGFDFAVWMVLLVLCVISYFSTLFILLAVWQAIHILISALRARKKNSAR